MDGWMDDFISNALVGSTTIKEREREREGKRIPSWAGEFLLARDLRLIFVLYIFCMSFYLLFVVYNTNRVHT